MSNSILDSYLVSLQFMPDQASLGKFQGVLKSAEASVAGVASGIASDILKAQFAVTGAFVSMGFGAIAFVDKLAMGDQQMRLFAQRSFMTLNQARSVKTALDVLGVSLEDVAWDRELHGRFETLYAQQDRINKLLGPEYEDQMKMVRDVRFELGKLQVSAQGFGALFTKDLLSKLGFGDGELTAQLEKMNAFVEQNLPKWSDEFSNDIIPMLTQTKDIAKETWGVVLEGAQVWQTLIGVLTGDKSLQDQDVNFHNLSRSIQYASHYLGEFLKDITTLETAGGKGIESVLLRFGSLNDVLHGNMKDGLAKLQQSDKLMMESGAIIAKANQQSITGPSWRPEDDLIKGFLQKSSQMMTPSDIQSLALTPGGASSSPQAPTVGAANAETANALRQLARNMAPVIGGKSGVAADLVYGQMALETGNFTHLAGMNNFSGIRDPKTGKYRNFGSVEEYENSQARVLTDYRYLNHGVREAVTGMDLARALKTPGYTYYGTDSERNYGLGVERYRHEYPDGMSVGAINVHITQPGMTHQEVQSAVTVGVRDGLARQTKTQMPLTAGGY